MKDVHYFDIRVADLAGVNAALVFDYIGYWTVRNMSEGVNIIDGKAWVNASIGSLARIYYYLTESRIKTALQKLHDADLIECGRAVIADGGRIKAYTLTEKGRQYYEPRSGK